MTKEIIFLLISIAIVSIGLFLFIRGIICIKNVHQINKNIDDENKKIQNKNNVLLNDNALLRKDKENLISQTNQQKEILSNLKDTTEELSKAKQKISQKAFENYCNILEEDYQAKEEEYHQNIDTLSDSYSKLQLSLMEEIQSIQSELEDIKSTRAATIAAQLKEKEIKEQLAFYCLTISQTNLDDIKVLERIKPQLHNPRILSMLIWQTYYQKPMTALCNNILGSDTVCGIYKITDQTNGLCYVGQSVDCSKRWKDHAKCGLGIDTPAGNKLYKAMQEVGLYNFSFELLEACSREQLNEKEKYYINLYQSDKYGYNILSGNN